MQVRFIEGIWRKYKVFESTVCAKLKKLPLLVCFIGRIIKLYESTNKVSQKLINILITSYAVFSQKNLFQIQKCNFSYLPVHKRYKLLHTSFQTSLKLRLKIEKLIFWQGKDFIINSLPIYYFFPQQSKGLLSKSRKSDLL